MYSYCSETIEICLVEVKVRSNEFMYFACIYRPHSDSIENFTLELLNILNSDILHSKKVIILGDFNVNLFLENSQVDIFISEMQSLNFICTIDKPTRFSAISGQRASLLDQIWTNYHSQYNTGIIYSDVSDHCSIFIKFPHFDNNSEKIHLKFRMY